MASTLAVGGAATLATDHAHADVDPRTPGTLTPPADGGPFLHGVASGDPLPTSVVLWTRITPTPQAQPGSGRGPRVRVGWEVALDADFATVVAHGTATTGPERDHTVHVDPFTLSPDTAYFYRFTALDGPDAGATSPVGRTRTTPEDDAAVERWRLAVCSCANLEAGYFEAYRDIADRAGRGEFDAVVHLGDYIYEYATGAKVGKNGVARAFHPPHALVTRADYAARYGQYRLDPSLQRAHAALPWIVTWDDHEVADNWHADGSPDHHADQGSWADRRDGAMRAYFDWLPVRGSAPADGGRLYRTLRVGTLAELHMLDLRSYRRGPGQLLPGRAGSTIVGAEQFTWLSGKLRTSDTRWSLVGTSVMISPVSAAGLDDAVRPLLAELIGVALPVELNATMNLDQWDGYVADRHRLLEQIAADRPDGSTVFLTGDIHSEWAGVVRHGGEVIGAELVTSSVSATNVDDRLHLPKNNPVSRLAAAHLLANNGHFSHLNLDEHGYLEVVITREDVAATWWRVDDVEAEHSPLSAGPSARYGDAQLTMTPP
ncbi:phosphodiesterase/alkaline phosphatase D [Corynebacterium uterequi]|uniref:Phosphodiesterase/alkaline phosphatase D n=2 Tax=Corynebacterium uterequi TaxID=1072256 RepID=A0A0G3HFH8_9CORY|nr:phosphodiesterase/alkaline phosphatase D [Corynebacterium uterequi]